MTDSALPNHGTPWSKAEERKLRDLYPDTHTTDLETEFGRTAEAIKTRAKKLELTKSEEYRAANQGPDKAAIQNGLDAETRFEAYAEERGWTWYRNSLFRNYHSNKNEYEHTVDWIEQLLTPPQEDWIENEKAHLREDLAEARTKLQRLKELPAWFVGLRGQVDRVLNNWEHGWTAYPDYILGDRSDGPCFVEVKYGTSNLSRGQYEFFGFLQDHGLSVYIFRVYPSGEEAFAEWDGGWK